MSQELALKNVLPNKEETLFGQKLASGNVPFELDVALPVCLPTPVILRPVTWYYVHMAVYHRLPDRSSPGLCDVPRCGASAYTHYTPCKHVLNKLDSAND